MIAIIDYGVGNLFSLQSSLKHIGADCAVTRDAALLDKADKVILPGVGAFGDAMEALKRSGADELVLRQAQKGKPVMGICLGMQLLFDRGFEYGTHQGLGLLPGDVCDLAPVLEGQNLKVPHMGWNSLMFHGDNALLRHIRQGEFVYWVHSHYVPVSGLTVASASYGGLAITGIAAKDNVMGCQFHPEKSGETGLNILRAFCEM